MLKEIKYYPYLYIFLWFLPFSTIFLKKQAEIIHSTKGSIKIKTDKKTSDGKLIPKNLIYFLKYFIVFLFVYFLGGLDFNIDKTTLVGFSIAILFYSFFYFKIPIDLNIKILIIVIGTITLLGLFYYFISLKFIMVVFLLVINMLIPIHIFFKFLEDIKIKREYYFLSDEKLIIEVLKEK